jgi:hypothetical protein
LSQQAKAVGGFAPTVQFSQPLLSCQQVTSRFAIIEHTIESELSEDSGFRQFE